MKTLLILLATFTSFAFHAQFLNQNEEIVYSFETKKGKKMVVVKDQNNAYIQYRFGSKKIVELEFPKERNIESWKQFKYNSYWRGGGKENSGMEIDNLYFENKGYQYLIYRTYFAENEKDSTGHHHGQKRERNKNKWQPKNN